ncbi:MAG: DNA polymerase III subunit alpha, partial [SAR86 cluster bacterium]
GVDEELAGSIFDIMEKFAGYGFNKSHSAAYALVSYQTAWLKTHYPSYFMAAVLSADMQNTDKIVILIEECRSMKLVLVPPDVNGGQLHFTVNDRGEIVYGLGAIKGLGQGPVSAILAAREQREFTSLLDFCQRVDTRSVNKRTLEALIKAGAFDRLSDLEIDLSRAMLMSGLRNSMQAAEQGSRNQASGVEDLFGEIKPVTPAVDEFNNSVACRPWPEQQRLAAEKETLGLYLSGHPIEEYLPELAQITKERLANLRPQRNSQLIAGLLVSIRTMKSKSGDTIAFLVLDDRSARFEVSLFAKEYEKFREVLQKDAILVVDCVVTLDDYSGNMRGRAKQVMKLVDARQQRVRRLCLDLKAEKLHKDFCKKLAHILEPYHPQRKKTQAVSGQVPVNGASSMSAQAEQAQYSGCPVVVHYERFAAKGCIMLGADWTVSPHDELIQKLRSEYGKGTVRLEYS